MRYKAALVIADAIKNINAALAKPRILNDVTWLDKWIAETGKIKSHPNSWQVPVDKHGVRKMVNGFMSHDYDLKFTDAKALAAKIDFLNSGSDHLNIKGNAQWQRLYRVKRRDFPFMDENGDIDFHEIWTIPCHNCGCVVPWSSMQVDHYMPQAGSSDLWALKTLRALDLTVQGATGRKGSNLNALDQLKLNPKGYVMGDYSHFQQSTDAAKWTTTDKGAAFLSLIARQDWITGLNKACMNSFLNLSPLCRECNGEKSDQIKVIA